MTSNNETNSNGKNWQKPETIEIPKHFCELSEFKKNPRKNGVLVELEFEHIADFSLSIHGLIAMHKRGLLHLAENTPTQRADNETIFIFC